MNEEARQAQTEPNWTNYVVHSKFSPNTEGHLPACDLKEAILGSDGRESYHNMFDLEPRQDFKDYKGKAKPALGLLLFDFDGEDALTQVRGFVELLGASDIYVWFSGSKGFHVGVPEEYLGLSHDESLPKKLAYLARELKKKFSCLDSAIYNPNRKFRVPGSRHDKTGLYKILVHPQNSLDEIRRLAILRGNFWREKEDIQRAPLMSLVSIMREYKERGAGTVENKVIKFRGKYTYDTEAIEAGCEFLKASKANPGSMSEPEWYAMLGIVGHLEDGHKKAHEYSEGHPDYQADVTDAKLEQALASSPPRTCESVDQLWGKCKTCPFYGKVGSPISIERYQEPGIKDLFLEPIGRVPRRMGEDGKVKAVSQDDAKKHFLNYFGENLLKSDSDLFFYTGTHWRQFELGDHHALRAEIAKSCGGTTSSFDEAVYKKILWAAASPPRNVDIFNSHPFAANFLNGTLHLVRQKDATYELEFKKHWRGDYLINVLPYEYKEGDTTRNVEFLSMLERVFEGDVDKDQKIRAVKQMYGACLVQAFPHLFMLYGPPGTGKSTIIKLAMRLVHRDNLCNVVPSKFSGFNMTTMAGKLLNFDTDIPFHQPIQDDIVKKIVDRVPMRIERKKRDDIYAPLPAIHIFGGNTIPQALDGASKAHDRRWTFIEFNKVVGKGQYDKEFDQWVYEKSPQGLLNFAIEGLVDLIGARGHFSVPDSGREKMRTWQNESDPVALFLEDIEKGQMVDYEDGHPRDVSRLILDKEGQMMRSKVWDIYVGWVQSSFGRSVTLSKHRVFERLRVRGFMDKRTKTGWQFHGMRVVPREDAPF